MQNNRHINPDNHHDENLWIIGYGDIGRRVANLYQKQGIQTSATVGSKESLQALQENESVGRKQPSPVLLMNLDDEHAPGLDSLERMKNSHERLKNNLVNQSPRLFYFIPPPSKGQQDKRLQRFLETVKEIPERIVLISTTGVYGDCQGQWVDETQPLAPQADRAVRRVHAEELLKNWAAQYERSYVILRVPGIYAQDRLPLARIKKGLPVVKATEAPWTNRIHADDLAMACYLAMNQEIHNEVLNISDGNPSTMTDYFNQVADYANLPRPPQISLQEAKKTLSTGMLSYLQESRRVDNRKMLDMLGIKLRYPSLHESLKKTV